MSVKISGSSGVTFPDGVTQGIGIDAHRHPFRNKVINGNFDVWQRGTSSTLNDYGTADRWFNGNSGSTKTASQQAFTVGQVDVPNSPKFYSRTVVTSAAGTGAYVAQYQKIEGVRTLSGRKATVSFYAKADAAKPIAIDMRQHFGTGGTPSAAVAGIGAQKFNLTTAWQKITAVVDIPSIAGKTLGANNDDFLELVIWFDAGTDLNTRTASLGQQSGTFDIAQVQLEEGAVATEFEDRPLGLEEILCKRYCQKIGGGNGYPLYQAYSSGAADYSVSLPFPVIMRNTPSVTKFGTWSVNTLISQPFAGHVSKEGFALRVTSSGAGHFTCWANSADDYFLFSAEL